MKATLARYRWTVFKSVLLQEAGSLGRLISEALDVPENLAPPGAAQAPAGPPATP